MKSECVATLKEPLNGKDDSVLPAVSENVSNTKYKSMIGSDVSDTKYKSMVGSVLADAEITHLVATFKKKKTCH